MKDVTDMDAAVVAICCQLLGTGSCNMYFPAIPISSAALLRHSRVVRVQGKLLDK